jgi:hypothetical protein
LYLGTTLVSGGIQTVGAQMFAALLIIFLQTFFLLCRNISGICKYLFVFYKLIVDFSAFNSLQIPAAFVLKA